ncbi:MAG: acetylornithine deacetylase [Nevskiales bacterium]
MTALPPLKNLLSDLIALPSVSCADPRLDMSNRPLAGRLAGWLSDLGFHCELLPVDNQSDKCNLLATLGRGVGGLVLSGHLDTVPYDEGAWRSDPFRLTERDGRMYGLGTADMKSFLALAVEAAKEFTGRKLREPLIVLGTADEESSMAGALALAKAGIPKARHAVIGEPTGLKPVRAHKGIFTERIIVRGRAGHSSNPALGANAIEGMQRVLTALGALRDALPARAKDKAYIVPHSTLNLGCIHGGDSPNRIPASCVLDVDLRFVPGLELESLRAELHERVSQALAGTDFPVEFEPLFVGTPPLATAADAAIVRAAEELTGHAAGAVDFATEGALFNQIGMQTVILGPGDIENAHQPDEYLELSRLTPTVELLRGLIARFCL